MPDPRTIQRLKLLRLSASDLVQKTGWAKPVIEEYLSMIDSLITLAELIDIQIDKKLEEMVTDFENGTIPVVKDGFLVSESDYLSWDITNKLLDITGIAKTEGRRKKTIVVSTTPYSVQPSDEVVYFDTDSIAITANLPEGTDGEQHRLVNVGTSGNNVTINPNGIELLFGDSSQYLADAEALDMSYLSSKGWF